MLTSTGQPERRLLWHPRQDNKFIVGGGSQITLYEYATRYPEIKLSTSQHDLHHMKCFAWSPDPAFDDLVAVGSSTGKVDLLRLEATKFASRNSVLQNRPAVPLHVRNSRSCNAVAFCTADPNYLAVGLDKVRGDCSLVIWDIQACLPSLSVSPTPPSPTIHGTTTSTSRPQPQIPHADTGNRIDNRVLQQHAPTEVVSSLAFLSHSTHLLLAGISLRWLRLFDLRSPVPSITNVASKVQGIVTDPFDQHRIGCFGDGIVTIWDARKLTSPLLTFTEKDASADGSVRVRPGSNPVYTAIEFSSTRRGMLAALEKESTYVRFWDMTWAQGSSEPEHAKDPSQSSKVPRMSWANLPWAAGSGGTRSQNTLKDLKESDSQTSGYSLVLCDTRKTKKFADPLVSFALAPSAQTHPLTSKIIVLTKDGDLELHALHDMPKQAIWSARGDFTFGAGQTFRVFPGFQDVGSSNSWDAVTGHETEQAQSQQPRDVSSIRSRGRSKPRKPSPAMFGRGDDHGFPALGATLTDVLDQGLNGITASRSGKPKTNGDNTHRRNRHSVQEKNEIRQRKQHSGPIHHIVEDDMSMIMKRRAFQGYGPDYCRLGLILTDDDFEFTNDASQSLSELWTWISHCKALLCYPTPRLHGYDFAYKGLIGIWEGFPPLQMPKVEMSSTMEKDFDNLDFSTHEKYSSWLSNSPIDDSHGDFQAALAELLARLARQGGENTNWKPTVPTAKLDARKIALLLSGWPLKDEDLMERIADWEMEGKISQATCWLVFTRQHAKAVELLMRSRDESHYMMSGTLAALIPHASGSIPPSAELRDQCGHLIVRLQDPYFRVMLTHLIMGDWIEVLDEEALPLSERLAIAFQFLDDKAVTSYLHRIKDRACSQGDIDALSITGLSKAGLDILQSYVDCTGDVQTAAILSSSISSPDPRVERWRESYRDLLDGFKMFHHRVKFDMERGRILQDIAMLDGNPLPPPVDRPQISIRCNYCNKTINPPEPEIVQKGKATACPHCGRSLPLCSICLMTLSIIPDVAREAELAHSSSKATSEEEAIVVCQRCRHGGHANHVLEWFEKHMVCPVADCDCSCADEG